MTRLTPRFSYLILCLLSWLTLPAIAADKTPAPIATLESQGISFVDTFPAPSGLTGYAAMFQGKPMAVYLTKDKQHAIIGTLIDADGNDLGAEELEKRVAGPRNQAAWEQLEKSTWVADGNNKAARIVYMFSDPNCPYCHQFWEMARPWVKANKVQIRHVLVGLIRPSSLPKAATILAAKDPAAALDQNERQYDDGGIDADETIDNQWAVKVKNNTMAMLSLGLHATPSIFYQDANGQVQMVQGAPRSEEQLEAIMGSTKP